MIEVNERVDVDSTPEAVWAVLSDPDRRRRYDRDRAGSARSSGVAPPPRSRPTGGADPTFRP